MDETAIDRVAMGRLAKALVFICGPDHSTTVALKAAAESGSERDINSYSSVTGGIHLNPLSDFPGPPQPASAGQPGQQA